MHNINEELLEVGTSSIGETISIKKYTIDSGKEGKTIYIQGGTHGGEITLPIIRNLFDFLSTNLKCGKVIIIPFANPVSWRQRIYFYTMGKFNFLNGKDFNRVFGKDNGDINNKIATTILKQAEQADFAIDLHTSRESKPYSIFSSLDYIKYVKYLNIFFNQYCQPTEEYTNTFDVQLYKRNIPNVVIECGSHDEVNRENINNISNGIINLLKHFNMVEGEAILNKEFSYYEDPHLIYSENGGIIEYHKNTGDFIKKGEKILSILYGNLKSKPTEVCAPFDCYMVRASKTHICDGHEEVANLIKIEDLITIQN